jgi:hypothetical protein
MHPSIHLPIHSSTSFRLSEKIKANVVANMTASQNALLEDMEQVCARLPKAVVVMDDVLLADEALITNKEDAWQEDDITIAEKDEAATESSRIILTLDDLLVWPISLATGFFLTLTLVCVYFWTFDTHREKSPTSNITTLDSTASSSSDDLIVMQQLQTLNANLAQVLAQTHQLLQFRQDIQHEMQAAQEKLAQLQELIA